MDKEIWVHTSSNEVKSLSYRKQRTNYMEITNKPIGLWIGKAYISDSGIYSEWLEFMHPDKKIDSYFVYEVEFDNRLLDLNSKNYWSKLRKYRIRDEMTNNFFGWLVNWEEVSKEYNGIIFTEYQKQHLFGGKSDDERVYRFHDMVDIESGCIWNPESITKFERIV